MNINPLIVKRPQTPSEGIPVYTGNEFYIDSDNKRLWCLIIADSESTVTFVKGDGIQSANDLVIPLGMGERKAVQLDPGSFQINTGEYKNKIKATATSNVEIIALAE